MNRRQLRHEELEALLGALPQVVLLIGEDRKIHYINRAEGGHTREEIIGSDATHGVPPEQQAAAAADIESVFRTGEIVQRLTEIRGPDDRPMWFEGALIPIRRDGRVAAVAIVSTNVTERVHAEQEVAMLERLVPLCAWCKKIRTEEGAWRTLEAYLEETESGHLTHGMCPECEQRLSEAG